MTRPWWPYGALELLPTRLRNGPAGERLRRLARVYLGGRVPGYLDRYDAWTAPLRADLSELEPLFAGSESWFRATLEPFVEECRWPVTTVYNTWFETVDAELYYSAIRTYRPSLVIEVGSGYSTRFARAAVRRNGRGRVLCIDPEPRVPLPPDVEHLAAPIEQVDPGLFASLGPGDILFIDSSHTVQEAAFHVERILPSLAPGVVCQHHDIPFPWDIYPGTPDPLRETDVLLAFYRSTTAFRILAGAAYVRFRNIALVRRLVRSYRLRPGHIPVSLWTQRA